MLEKQTLEFGIKALLWVSHAGVMAPGEVAHAHASLGAGVLVAEEAVLPQASVAGAVVAVAVVPQELFAGVGLPQPGFWKARETSGR